MKTLCNTIRLQGNVRELGNVLERAIALSASGTLGVEKLQLRQSAAAIARPADQLTAGAGGAASDNPFAAFRPISHQKQAPALGDQLEDIEREAIKRALVKTRLDKTATA